MKTYLSLALAGFLAATAAGAPADEPAAYCVVDGSYVDAQTLAGWRTWRAMACERCHGNEQQGLVGPALTQSLKVLSKEEFKTAVLGGRPTKGMPTFGEVPDVIKNIDGLYGFLKGRADGAIKPGRLSAIKQSVAADSSTTGTSACPPAANPTASRPS